MDEQTAAMTPEERVAAGLCPECGRDMKGINPTSHSAEHWQTYIFPTGSNAEAIKRQGLLNGMPPPTPTPTPPGAHGASSPPPKPATSIKV